MSQRAEEVAQYLRAALKETPALQAYSSRWAEEHVLSSRESAACGRAPYLVVRVDSATDLTTEAVSAVDQQAVLTVVIRCPAYWEDSAVKEIVDIVRSVLEAPGGGIHRQWMHADLKEGAIRRDSRLTEVSVSATVLLAG